MDVGTIIFLVVVVFVIGYAILIYNNLVNLKHAVSQAWSNIDVLLKQRHDELPKLVETCKQYMKHERETLEQVMRARAAVATARDAHDVGGVGDIAAGTTTIVQYVIAEGEPCFFQYLLPRHEEIAQLEDKRHTLKPKIRHCGRHSKVLL